MLGSRSWKREAETFYREPESVKKLQEAGAIKPYSVGAGAGAGKNALKSTPRNRAFLEPEPVKEIYKNGSKEPGAMLYSEGAESESQEPVKKDTGSPTLVYFFWSYTINEFIYMDWWNILYILPTLVLIWLFYTQKIMNFTYI